MTALPGGGRFTDVQRDLRGAIVFLFGYLLSAMAPAQTDSLDGLQNVSAEHQRIEQRRAELTRTLDEQESACANLFAVNACLADVQSRRREAMAELRRQEAILHDSERKRRSEEALGRTQEKIQQHAQDQAAQAAQQEKGASDQPDKKEKKENKAGQSAQPVQARDSIASTPARKSSGLDDAQRAQNRTDYQQKLDRAKQRKEELDQRLKNSGKKPSPALPDPATVASATSVTSAASAPRK